MLKTFYENETDIPENLKGAYIAQNGRYELDTLSNDHPVVTTKKSLEESNRTLKTQNSDLLQDKTRLESSALPEGKVAVEPEIEKLGQAAKTAGLKISEIPTLKTKSDDLQKQVNRLTGEKQFREVLDAEGVDADLFFDLWGEQDLPTIEKAKETVDGKEQEVSRVVTKDAAGAETKQAFDDFLKGQPKFAKHYDKLKTSQGEGGENGGGSRQWVKQESGTGGGKESGFFDKIREKKAEEEKTQRANQGASLKDTFYRRGESAVSTSNQK